jgi:hypothetical protein
VICLEYVSLEPVSHHDTYHPERPFGVVARELLVENDVKTYKQQGGRDRHSKQHPDFRARNVGEIDSEDSIQLTAEVERLRLIPAPLIGGLGRKLTQAGISCWSQAMLSAGNNTTIGIRYEG